MIWPPILANFPVEIVCGVVFSGELITSPKLSSWRSLISPSLAIATFSMLMSFPSSFCNTIFLLFAEEYAMIPVSSVCALIAVTKALIEPTLIS